MNWIHRGVLRLKTTGRDKLFYSKTVRSIGSRLYSWRAWLAGVQGNEVAALLQECTAARLAASRQAVARLEHRIRQRVAGLGPEIDWDRWIVRWTPGRIENAVVLKPWVSPREKGVIFISFEYQWARLLGLSNLTDFAQRYTLVVAPSASPAYGLVQSVFPSRFPAPYFSLISNDYDRGALQAMSDQIVCVPLYASNWVNPDRFRPDASVPRDIDIVMIANFAPVKRHFALFQALREMPRHLRVVVAGQPDAGYTVEHVRALAVAYGVADRVEILDSLTHAEVAQLLRRAKVSTVLSRREGACMVVTESLFSGTPVGILEDAVMGSRAFINSHTGRFLNPRHLGHQFTTFVEQAASYRPREWALENGVDCYGSTKTLNSVLREASLSRGEPWTMDIAPHAWQFNPVLVRPADLERLKPTYVELLERFQLHLGLQYTMDELAVEGKHAH